MSNNKKLFWQFFGISLFTAGLLISSAAAGELAKSQVRETNFSGEFSGPQVVPARDFLQLGIAKQSEAGAEVLRIDATANDASVNLSAAEAPVTAETAALTERSTIEQEGVPQAETHTKADSASGSYSQAVEQTTGRVEQKGDNALLLARADAAQLSDDGKEATVQEPAPSGAANATPKRKILVVLSSEHELALQNGVMHPTGFFLDELMFPVSELLQAGHELVFANPKGNKAVMDAISDNPSYFSNTQEYQTLRALCKQIGLCGDGVEGAKTLKSLQQVISEGLGQYDAVFVPGGHAPMIDLWKDSNLGKIMHHFHDAGKVTALICHGPIALLSAMNNPQEFVAALIKNNMAAATKAAQGWIYKNYSLTVFTTIEEPAALKGAMVFYPDSALRAAGANVQSAPPKTSHVVVDRELITGQNPMSGPELAKTVNNALQTQAEKASLPKK